MQPDDTWLTAYERFDPEEETLPANWRVERPKSPIMKMLQQLQRRGTHKFLLLGAIGTGKSTELRRIGDLQVETRFTLFFDISRHFEKVIGDSIAVERLQPWEALMLIGLALYKAGQAEGFLEDRHEQQLEKAIQQLAPPSKESEKPKVNISGLVKMLTVAVAGGIKGATVGSVLGPAGTVLGAAGGALMANQAVEGGWKLLEAATEAFQWTVPLGREGAAKVDDQDQAAQALLLAVDDMILSFRQQGRAVVIVVDGLDRIRKRESAERFFLRSALIGSLQCSLILTGPLVLCRQGLAGNVRKFEPRLLTEIPVALQADPFSKNPEGMEFFREVYRLRTSDIHAHFPDDLIDELAYYSGGHVRTFVKLVRETIGNAMDEHAPAVNRNHVKMAISETRRVLEMGLRTNHRDLLQKVMEEHRLPATEIRADGSDPIDDLLNNFWVIPYPNDIEWYFPHPMLTLYQLKRPG